MFQKVESGGGPIAVDFCWQNRLDFLEHLTMSHKQWREETNTKTV